MKTFYCFFLLLILSFVSVNAQDIPAVNAQMTPVSNDANSNLDEFSATVDNNCDSNSGSLDVFITLNNIDAPLFYYYCDDPSSVFEVFSDGTSGFTVFTADGFGYCHTYCLQFIDEFGNPVSIENETLDEPDFDDGIIAYSIDCFPFPEWDPLYAQLENICNDEDETFNTIITLHNVFGPLFYYTCDDSTTLNELTMVHGGRFGYAVLGPFPANEGEVSSYCVQFFDVFGNPIFIEEAYPGMDHYEDGIIADSSVVCTMDDEASDSLSATVDIICDQGQSTFGVLITLHNVDAPLFYYTCDDSTSICEVAVESGSFGFVSIGPILSDWGEISSFCVQFVDEFGNSVDIETDFESWGWGDYDEGAIGTSYITCINIGGGGGCYSNPLATVENTFDLEEETLETVITLANVYEPLLYYHCGDPSTITEVITDGSTGFVSLGPFAADEVNAPSYCIQFVDVLGNIVAVENAESEEDYDDGIIALTSSFCDFTSEGGNTLNDLTATVENVFDDETGTFQVVVTLFNVNAQLNFYFCDDPSAVTEVMTDGRFGFVIVGPIPSDQGAASSYCIQFVDEFGNPVAIDNIIEGEPDYPDGIIADSNLGATVIALELTTFKGEVLPNFNKLMWEIASTDDSKFISLQRSKDGQKFSDITEFYLESNSNQTQAFEYLDQEFYRETTYYRLLETDINGNGKVVSKIISIQRKESTSNWAFYPNPVKDILSILTNQPFNKKARISIYSSLGVLIKQENVFLEKGNNQLSIDMAEYPSGVYFVSIDNGAIMKKIIR